MKSAKRDNQVRELFEAGVKGAEIANRVGISETTVWATVRRLGLTMRRGHPVRIKERGSFEELKAHARRWGRVDFDEADLPSGTTGWICFIGDRPGYACGTELAALRSAIALR